MPLRSVRCLSLLVLLLVPAVALAQFGHPLKGQWSGGWGKDNANRLLLDFEWDGKAITGVINPGPNQASVKNVTFDYSKPEAWGVKLEAEGKDASGQRLPIVVEGTLENIGAYTRILRGTWTQGKEKAPFIVTRN